MIQWLVSSFISQSETVKKTSKKVQEGIPFPSRLLELYRIA